MTEAEYVAWLRGYLARVPDHVPLDVRLELIEYKLDEIDQGKKDTPGINEVPT